MSEVSARLRLGQRDWPPLTSVLLGEQVTVEAIFVTPTGAPIEVSGVVAALYQPPAEGQTIGATPSLPLTRTGVGVWTGSRVFDRLGQWAIEARCTGPSAAVARADLLVGLGGPARVESPRAAAAAGVSAEIALAAAASAGSAEAAAEAARDAALAAAAVSQQAAAGLVPLDLTVATALTQAAHGARTLFLTGGAHQLSLAWADNLDGFACTLINCTTYPASVALSGFSEGSTRGGLQVAVNGTATLFCRNLGGQRLAWLEGRVE